VLRRLPRRIFVNLPTLEERKEILKVLLKDEKLGTSRATIASSDEERDDILTSIASRTENFSGSDLKNLCIGGALNAVRATISENDTSRSSFDRVLISDDFVKSLESGDVVPSLNDKGELLKLLKDWDKDYGTGYSKGAARAWGF
jgi:SpoVK/Ycf46/Vps4 family AAA+-type ATPase